MARVHTLSWLSLVGVCFALVPSFAAAHGRFPEAQAIESHPSDPDLLAVFTTFGALVSRDGGATYRYTCREVMNVSLSEDPTHLLLSDGALSVASFDGLTRSDPAICNFGYPEPELERVVVIDQVRDPSDPLGVYALTSSGSADNSLFYSSDDGFSFTATSDPIEPELFEKVRVSPSNPDVIYLSGAYPATPELPRRAFVHRTDDRGATFTRFPFTLENEERNVHVLGVDPRNPMRVFMRVVRSRDFEERQDRLVVSEDGGETFADLLSITEIRGFAISPDGETVWVGGRGSAPDVLPDGGLPDVMDVPLAGTGLFRSDDGGETFTRIQSEMRIGCLALRAGELWACADNFLDGFAIGRSADGGESFDAVLRFEEIAGQVECTLEDDARSACRLPYADAVRDLRLDSGIGPVDAGPDGGTGGDDPGCGCAVPGRSGAQGGQGVVAFVFVLIAIRRRRLR